MVRHTSIFFQHLLQDFLSVFDHFGALCIKYLKIKARTHHDLHYCYSLNDFMKNETNGFLLMNNWQDKKETSVGRNLFKVSKKDFISVFYGVIINSLIVNLKKLRWKFIDLINLRRMEFIHEARIPINYLVQQS